MGWWEVLPIVAQLKSAVQAACGDMEGAERTQIEFANACSAIPVLSQCKSAVQAACGDVEAAAQTQEDFSRQCVRVSQLRSVVEAGLGHHEEARKTQELFLDGLGLAHSTVIVPMAAAPALAGAAIAVAGFGTGGIAAGSAAAGLMSSYGGSVAAGSLCATLQSAGAVGLSAGLTAASVASGGAAGAGVAAACDAAKKDESEADRCRILDGQKCECTGLDHVPTCRHHPEHDSNSSEKSTGLKYCKWPERNGLLVFILSIVLM